MIICLCTDQNFPSVLPDADYAQLEDITVQIMGKSDKEFFTETHVTVSQGKVSKGRYNPCPHLRTSFHYLSPSFTYHFTLNAFLPYFHLSTYSFFCRLILLIFCIEPVYRTSKVYRGDSITLLHPVYVSVSSLYSSFSLTTYC